MARKKQQPSAPKLFTPTAAMIRFLFRELELLSKRRPYTQKQVASEAKVSEFQASRWHDVRGYDQWHADQLHGAAVRLFNKGKVAVGYRILATGDPKELETFGRVLGLLAGPGGDDGEGDAVNPHFTMNFLVPAPPISQGQQEAAKKMLPPPMTFDVPASVPVVSTR